MKEIHIWAKIEEKEATREQLLFLKFENLTTKSTCLGNSQLMENNNNNNNNF